MWAAQRVSFRRSCDRRLVLWRRATRRSWTSRCSRYAASIQCSVWAHSAGGPLSCGNSRATRPPPLRSIWAQVTSGWAENTLHYKHSYKYLRVNRVWQSIFEQIYLHSSQRDTKAAYMWKIYSYQQQTLKYIFRNLW